MAMGRLERRVSPLKMTRDYASTHVRFPMPGGPVVLTAYRSGEGPEYSSE